jgi:branched-chain amino acid transport system permease protein
VLVNKLSRRFWFGAGGLALLVLTPAVASVTGTPYLVTLVTRFVIYGLAAVSLDLVLGYGALVSFGHAMFFGVGGYVVAWKARIATT